MAEKSSPNLFILLDLDPNKPWNQVEFERQLESKRREWSKLVNRPDARGIQAKQNLGLIQEMKRIASDETQRQVQAETARQERSKEQADKLKQFDEDLELLQAKGHILQAELDQLVKQYCSVLSEADIRKRLSMPIEQGTPAARPRRQALDPVTAKAIDVRLKSLNKTNLYDFLGLDEKTESKLLVEKANRLYSGITSKGNKTHDDTLAEELIGHCLKIFKSEDERLKYNESVRLAAYDDIKKKIDLAAHVSNKIEARQMEQILRDARQQGLDPDETLTVITEYAGQKKYAILLPSGIVEAIQQLQHCGYCKQLNDANQKHCSQCGQPLSEPCPRCSKPVKSADMACGDCGFPCGNRAYVGMLLNDAEQARLEYNYIQALAYLEQARQAWPAGGKNPLAQKIKGLEDQIRPDQENQESLAKQVRDAIAQKRYYQARGLLLPLQKAMPKGSLEWEDYNRRVTEKIKEAEADLGKARALEKSNSEGAIDALQAVLRICQDCQEARDLLAKTPPTPPSALTVSVSGRVVHLSWKPSPSKGVRYGVVRSERARPASPKDGRLLATVDGTVYDDQAAEPGLPYFYAIYGNRQEVFSANAALSTQPVMTIQDVEKLNTRIADRQVHLTWKAPAHVEKILVVRSEKAYPAKVSEGTPIQVLGSQEALDNQVQNERRYFYTVFCQYKDLAGTPVFSAGARVEAMPQVPPAALQKLKISAIGQPDVRRLTFQWERPAKGDVVILKSNQPTGLPFGKELDSAELSHYGQIIKTTAGQASDEINRLGFYYYLPVVLFQGKAYIGEEQRYASVDNVTGLEVKNLGYALRLTWRWPPNCNEVLLAFSQRGWPVPNQTGTTTLSLTRAQYDLNGCHDILSPTVQDYYIIVFAVIGQGEQRIMASGDHPGARKLFRLRSRITLDYEVKKSALSNKFTLELNVKGEGTLPGLILIRKQSTLPLNKHDGETILHLEPQEIKKNHYSHALAKEAVLRQGYARLFLEDDTLVDSVIIRHPANEKLRLFF